MVSLWRPHAQESNLPEFLGGSDLAFLRIKQLGQCWHVLAAGSAADAEFVPARAALVANGSGSVHIERQPCDICRCECRRLGRLPLALGSMSHAGQTMTCRF